MTSQSDPALPESKPALNLGRKSRRRKTSSKTPMLIGIGVLACALFGLAVWKYVSSSKSAPVIHEEWARLLKVNNVYDILIDPLNRNHVWFATAEGVRLYEKDTGSWRLYGFREGLPSEQITSIAADSARVWFGTWSGVAFFERASGTWGRLALGDRVSQRRVLDVEKDGSYLWVSTTDGGIDRYNLEKQAWESFGKEAGLKTRELYCILATPEAVYAGSNQGILYIFNRATGTWTFTKNPEASSFVTKIWCLERDGADLWMGTSHKGVWQYNTKSGAWRTHQQMGAAPLILVYSLAIDSEWVWAGTPLGVVRYAKKSETWIGELTEGSQGKPYVMTSLASDEGYVWFGSYQQGLGKIMKDKPQVIPYSGGLEHDYVKAIGIGRNSLWLGYSYLGGYVDEFRKDSLVWKRNVNLWTGIPGENVSAIKCWENDVLVGTWTGFAYFDSSRSTWISSKDEFFFDSEVTDAVKAADGIYIGSVSGLYTYSPKQEKLAPFPQTSHLAVLAIAEDGADLWLGTRSGLFRFNPGKNQLDTIRAAGTDAINSLAVSGDSLWMGIPSKGISIYSKKSGTAIAFDIQRTKLVRYKAEDKALRVAQIKTLDGKIWITTNLGVAVIDPTLSKDFAITYADGLINNDALTVEADSVDYYFGLFGGLNRVSKKTLAVSVFDKAD